MFSRRPPWSTLRSTGPWLSFALFYLVPVLAAAWFLGRGPALLAGMTAGIAWFEAEAWGHRGEPTRDLMWTPLKPSDGSKDAYGLGWGNGNDGGLASVGHNGGQQGTSTAFTIAPAQKAGVVVLTNMEEIGASDLAQEILKVLVSATESTPKKK